MFKVNVVKVGEWRSDYGAVFGLCRYKSAKILFNLQGRASKKLEIDLASTGSPSK